MSRILLVDDSPAEWHVALSTLARNGLMDQATVVKDKGEALDFLHARGNFRRRAEGLPAVVVLGPTMHAPVALSVLTHIRSDIKLRHVPVVIITDSQDADLVRSAYAKGVNSLVRRDQDASAHAERYASLALFWAWANEPPPGCLPQPKSQRRQ